MYRYLSQYNISVLSSFNPAHMDWMNEDVAIFGLTLSNAEMAELDAVQTGKRSCPDCWTIECEACAATLGELGCPIGHKLPVSGKGNGNATECIACARLSKNKAAALEACGNTSRGETLETMLAKACGA